MFRLVCILVDRPAKSHTSEIYHDPVRRETWERVQGTGINWFCGDTPWAQAPYGAPTDMEDARMQIISETRERLTHHERNAALGIIGSAMPPFWDINLLSLIDVYLLACYPAIIPESMTDLIRWIDDRTYNFSGLTRPSVVVNRCHHIDWNCNHVSCGFMIIGECKIPIEKCEFQEYLMGFMPRDHVQILVLACMERIIDEFCDANVQI